MKVSIEGGVELRCQSEESEQWEKENVFASKILFWDNYFYHVKRSETKNTWHTSTFNLKLIIFQSFPYDTKNELNFHP